MLGRAPRDGRDDQSEIVRARARSRRARSGALVGTYEEFETAAPAVWGEITASGRYVFWSARGSGGFEEIATHVIPASESARSVLSQDDALFFTTVDRGWIDDDTSPGRILDAKTQRELMTVPQDVTTVWFSPSRHLFAALEPKARGDTNGPATIYSLDTRAVVARLPMNDVVAAAFAPDDSRIAVLEANDLLAIYALKPLP